MKLRNRALALLLSMVMMLTFMPALAFAEAEEGNGDVQEYFLIFDPNGGYFSVMDEDENLVENYSPITQGCLEGENQIIPESVYRRGYTHIGWSREKNGGTLVDFYSASYNVTKDETFYAQWSENPKATFDFNGGYAQVWDDKKDDYIKVYDTYDVYTTLSYDDKYYIGYMVEAEKPGYIFEGWFLDDGTKVDDIGNYLITEDTVFTAHWTRNTAQYIATFDAAGGTFDDGSETMQVADWIDGDGEVWLDSYYYYEPRKAGSVFSYWTDQSGKKYTWDDFDNGFAITKDTTFTANYEAGYKVTFKPDREGARKFLDNDDTLLPEYVTYVRKNSYLGGTPWFRSEDRSEAVIGWTDERGNAIDEDEYKVTADNTVLYAIWGQSVKVVLNGNGGLFDNDIPRQELYLYQGSDFEYAARFIPGGIQEAPLNMTQPHMEGSVFTGWYTDEECSQLFTQEKATEDYINSLDGATLELYAGFTEDDYSKVTIHANGGSFYREEEGTESTTLWVPNGTAFRFNEEVYKENDEGENYRIVGVYSDKDCTNEVNLVGEEYYVANGDIDLYPAWGEPLPDVYLELDSEYGDFYLDGDKELNAYAENFTDEKMDKAARIKVYDTSNGGAGDLDKLNPVTVLDDSQYISWDEDIITLYGPDIEEVLSGLKNDLGESIALDKIVLEVVAEVTSKNGEKLASEEYSVFPKTPYYDYRFEEVFGDYNEERDTFIPASDNKFELLLGNGHEWTGKYIDFWHEGNHYWSGCPEGEWFDYEITGITSSNRNVVKVTKGDGFDLSPVGLGTSVITVKYNNEEGVAQDPVKYTATVVGNKYYVWIDDSEHYDDEEETVVMNTVPGGSAVFTAKGSRVDASGTHNDGFTYNWSFADAFAANFATIDANGATATVNIKEDADLDNEDLREGIKVKVEAVDPDGQVKASDTAILRVVREFYEITNLPEVDPLMRTGQTVKFDPEVRYFGPDTQDLPGGYEVSDKPVMINYFDGNVDEEEGDDDYDEVQAIEITANGNAVKDGDTVSGPFTMKRIADANAYLHLSVYCGSDDEDYDDEDYSTARRNVYLDEIFNIKNAKVGGIYTQTYTGKMRKPVPDEVYVKGVEGENNEAWREDGDYTITYKNNTKVGKASLTLTGHGRFYGTKTVYFNIKPKKAVVSKVTPGKKKLTVKAKTKVSSTGGKTYQVWYRVKGTSSWKKKTTTKQSLVIKSLKKGKKYQVKIRAIKKIGSTTYYGAWSAIKTSGKIK